VAEVCELSPEEDELRAMICEAYQAMA